MRGILPSIHVFRNFATRRPVANRMLRQAKPNVGSYIWQANRPTHTLTQPWEHASFFMNVGRSGTGMVGTPNNPPDAAHTAFIGQPAVTLEEAKAMTRQQAGGIARTGLGSRPGRPRR